MKNKKLSSLHVLHPLRPYEKFLVSRSHKVTFGQPIKTIFIYVSDSQSRFCKRDLFCSLLNKKTLLSNLEIFFNDIESLSYGVRKSQIIFVFKVLIWPYWSWNSKIQIVLGHNSWNFRMTRKHEKTLHWRWYDIEIRYNKDKQLL